MSRTKAALSHFLLSVIIFCIVIFTLLFFWYPAPFFTASGGWQGLKIVASVDLVLGPLLTLIVFNNKKTTKQLASDLLIIALLQFSALAWGVNAIYQQRPVVVVFWEKTFITVPASELEDKDIGALKVFGDNSPVFIFAEKPKSVKGLEQMLDRISNKSLPPHHQLELFNPLRDHYAEMQSSQVDIDEIISSTASMKEDLVTILDKSGTTRADYDYFSLRSKYHNIILLFNHEGEVQDYISVPLRK